MKKVEAIIQRARLDAVLERLSLIGLNELYVSEARGFGRTHGHSMTHRGSAYEVVFVPKFRIEWYGDDDEADSVVRAIERAARSGQMGDGRIFVSTLSAALEI